MLKYPPSVTTTATTIPTEPPELAAGSASNIPMSSSVMVAMITQTAETRALCAHVASSIVSASGSTCGSRAAIAAAFDDLSTMQCDAVGELLRGRTC
jgi:hypothetical protein